MAVAAEFEEALDAFQRGELGTARTIAERELQRDPSAKWQHLLGLVHCRLGRPQDGLDHLQAALAAEPRNLQFRAMLVRALIDSGRASDALRYARRPGPGPLAADLWRLRAEAAQAAQSITDRTEAVRHLELEDLSARLAKDPDRLSLILDRGRVLGWLNRDEEAEADFRKVLESEPANAEAVRELGVVLERGNRLDDLRRLIDDAVAAGCDRDSFALLEALFAWRSGKAGEALQWLGRIAPAEGRVRGRQLEIKVHDALGNAEAAFAAAKENNAFLRGESEWRESARRVRARFRTSAEAITPEWARSWAPVKPKPHRPLAFLVGFPRSGTTLLDTFLMGHPQIGVLEEVPLIGAIGEMVGSVEGVSTLDEDRAEELRNLYLNALPANLPEGFDGLVVDKMPLNMLWAPLIYRLFPDARLLFAQRHPCDCVLSAFFQTFSLNPAMANFLDIADSAEFFDVAMDLWWRSERSLPLAWHKVTYEKLVENPEPELRAAIEFLQVDWRDELLDHQHTARKRGAISTPSYEQVTEPLSSRAVGRWRRYESQLRPVLPLLLPWAERLGYSS